MMLFRVAKTFMRPYYFVYLLGVVLTNFLSVAFATDLMEVYQQALQNDPDYQAAISNRLAMQMLLPQSRASLLPQLGSSIHAYTYHTPNPVGGRPTPGATHYDTQEYQIYFKQPLIAVSSWMTVNKANNLVKQANAQFAAATQDLIIHVARTYFDVLLAQDELSAVQAEKAAVAQQLDQVRKRFSTGLSAMTDLYNAQAGYDQVVASEITAQNTLRNSQEAIRRLTGQSYAKLARFKASPPLQHPNPPLIEHWLKVACQQNLNLLSKRYAMLAARENIKVQAGGHWPTLDLVGSYGNSRGNPSIPDGNNTRVGLELNLPLFSGGAIASQTQQAQYQFQVASADLEKAYRAVLVLTRQYYNNVLADISKIQADRQAIVSAQASLSSTKASFKAGTRTVLDVLEAQQKFYSAKRVAACDQYHYFLDGLLLKQEVASLGPNDLMPINRWLH